MLNAFICGNFHHEEEDVAPCSSSSSPKKSKRSKDHHSRRDNNPYSTRGLDKFSELLADLDQRRQKVYSTMNPHEISFVRFTYSNTDDFVPIVIKNKDKKKHKSQELVKVTKPMNDDNNKCETDEAANDVVVEERKQQPKLLELIKKKKKKKSLSWNNMLKYPSTYVPMVLILILVLLTMFGRSFVTLCTCVMWYIVPTLNDYISKQRKSDKKKKKMDKVIEGLVSPTSSSGKHSHQKSW
ncbi:hypothetical protein RIF29_12648 [Crotalaria pallida]|uniref:ZCF37 n=1 Tax=Crotalaria pallida TaxID=3830 RepID=A0AAN9P2A2_CROPI